jgi:hypothetical protein
MDASRIMGDELEKLVDRHIELCELFDGTRLPKRPAAPLLMTMSDGKASAQCLSDLAERAFAAYEAPGFAQDPIVYSLRIFLAEAIAKRV